MDFDSEDQTTIIKLGQSQSRILVAAVHWYDPQLEDFRDFMSWRGMRKGTEDSYKKNLLGYAKNVHELKMDEIEAALLNVLILIATGKTWGHNIGSIMGDTMDTVVLLF